jgi:hypothetical protein
MSKTAVDYLFEKLWATPKDKFTWQMILQEAKKKEKRQIIKSHIDAFDNIVVDFKKQEFAEQYYQETFEKDA